MARISDLCPLGSRLDLGSTEMDNKGQAERDLGQEITAFETTFSSYLFVSVTTALGRRPDVKGP